MGLRWGTVALIIAASAVLAPATSASHMQPTASIHLTDLAVQKDGSHRVRVDWTASCGANAPSAAITESEYRLMIVPRRAGGKPATAVRRNFDEFTGSEELDVLPGRRLFARVLLKCDDTVPGPTPEDESVAETARATADSPETIYVPPRLAGFSVPRGSYCNASARDQSRGIGAADFQTIEWKLQFGRASMLKSPSTAGLLKEVRLRAPRQTYGAEVMRHANPFIRG